MTASTRFSALIAFGAGVAITAAMVEPARANCNVGDVTLGGFDAAHCNFRSGMGGLAGPGGNPSLAELESFYAGPWTEGPKVDTPSGATNVANGLSLALTYTDGTKSGGWSLSGIDSSINRLVVAIKGGTKASYYIFTRATGLADGAISGTWSYDALAPQGVSNFTVYTSEDVPEPLTILGTLAAAGIGYGLKRRRDAAQTAEG